MAERPTVEIELAADGRHARDLAAGGIFVPGCTLPLSSECDLIVRSAAAERCFAARVVFRDPHGGAGLELVGFCAEMKAELARLAELAAADDSPDGTAYPSERLRHLSLPQQIKKAHSGELQERILLERMYGKAVWEALLRNPRITVPEVARIARMGMLPRPLIEIIVSNGAWLQIPEVRRALLSNPRLQTDQILRILRLMPKHELRLAAVQASYPFPVRDAAKRMLREAP